jgi:2-phospho-L-lactate transferase/gluconeogenesis factor (CofD/UPF0052 family)
MQLKNLNIVAIGGGHGLGKVLSTLSFMGHRLTGIVTTTDNGGSTGRLRQQSSTIAWGDLRNCLTQLVDDESIGSQLFNFRFEGDDELGGHNLGNLILYGLEKVQSSPMDSIKLVRRLLRVKTQVLPMSETPTDLMAFYPEGRCRLGELSVDDMPIMPKSLMLAPLLVRGISEAINQRKGHCVFIDNIVAENSPAAQLSLDQKLDWIEANIDCMPIDSVICQDNKVISSKVSVFTQDLADTKVAHHHDNDKLIAALIRCVESLNTKKLAS